MFCLKGSGHERAATEKVPQAPLCFHAGKLMSSSLILNIGLYQRGVRVEEIV